MLVDECVVQQVLKTIQAYPTKSIPQITKKVNQFFSRKETYERVQAIASTIISGTDKGLLSKYYPLLLFYTSPSKKGNKIVLDYRGRSVIKLFKEFSKDFGVGSHLKKFGNSKFKIFRIIPEIPSLELEKVREGDKEPCLGWDLFVDFLYDHCSYIDKSSIETENLQKIFVPKGVSEKVLDILVAKIIDRTSNPVSVSKYCITINKNTVKIKI